MTDIPDWIKDLLSDEDITTLTEPPPDKVSEPPKPGELPDWATEDYGIIDDSQSIEP